MLESQIDIRTHFKTVKKTEKMGRGVASQLAGSSPR